jgi:hypothetical protein
MHPLNPNGAIGLIPERNAVKECQKGHIDATMADDFHAQVVVKCKQFKLLREWEAPLPGAVTGASTRIASGAAAPGRASIRLAVLQPLAILISRGRAQRGRQRPVL